MRFGLRVGLFLSSWSITLVVLAALAVGEALGHPGTLGDMIEARGAVYGAAALASGILSFVVARVALGPLVAAARAARRFGSGDTAARIEVPASGDDLADLATSFNETAERLVTLGESAARRTGELSAAVEELRSRDEHWAREARMSVRMQRRIVPRFEELPQRPELAFAAVYDPAENTGGDLYDAVRVGKNGCALLVADVSGRGVSAALIAAMVKNSFRAKVAWGAKAAEILAEVNAELVPVIADSDHFVTAFYAVLDLEAGQLSYAVAGHPPAFLLRRRTAAVEELDAEGTSLGVVEDAAFASGKAQLEEGDRLVLFTDGVTGARNFRGEIFGRERLATALARVVERPLSELPQIVAFELDAFMVGAPRSDDRVIIACEFRAFARSKSEGPRKITESEDWRSLARRGATLASKGEIGEAVRVYERLLEIEPEDAAALNNLGALYWRMGRRDDAIERFRAAARIDPADPRIRRNMNLVERFALRNESSKQG